MYFKISDTELICKKYYITALILIKMKLVFMFIYLVKKYD